MGCPKVATEAAWAQLPQPPWFPGDGPKTVCFQPSRALVYTEIPLHSRDVAPHVHSILDSPATDILDGHRVSLRDRNMGCELGAPTGLNHRGRPASPEHSPQPSWTEAVSQSTLFPWHVCFLINHLIRIKLSYCIRPFNWHIFHLQRSHAQGLPVCSTAEVDSVKDKEFLDL